MKSIPTHSIAALTEFFQHRYRVNTRRPKAWTAIDRLSVMWKSDLSDKIKHSFFPSSVRINTDIWTLTEHMEKKLEAKNTRMLWAVLNKSWKQYLTKQQQYGYLLPITKTIQIRQTGHAGHSWKSKDEFISDIYLWTRSHERATVGWPATTYIQQLCADTGCSLEDLLGAMDKWREKVREICSCKHDMMIIMAGIMVFYLELTLIISMFLNA